MKHLHAFYLVILTLAYVEGNVFLHAGTHQLGNQDWRSAAKQERSDWKEEEKAPNLITLMLQKYHKSLEERSNNNNDYSNESKENTKNPSDSLMKKLEIIVEQTLKAQQEMTRRLALTPGIIQKTRM